VRALAAMTPPTSATPAGIQINTANEHRDWVSLPNAVQSLAQRGGLSGSTCAEPNCSAAIDMPTDGEAVGLMHRSSGHAWQSPGQHESEPARNVWQPLLLRCFGWGSSLDIMSRCSNSKLRAAG